MLCQTRQYSAARELLDTPTEEALLEGFLASFAESGSASGSPSDSAAALALLPLLDACNELAALLLRRGAPRDALPWLHRADAKCLEYNRLLNDGGLEVDELESLTLVEHQQQQQDARSALENAHTMTGYLLAQIYGALGDSMKSSEYCLRTLQRQLKQEDGCRLNWALDCMTLSQYYTEKRVFECSYQCLVASQSVLDALCAENNIKLEEENKQKYKSDEIERAKSDLDWIWGKFYLSLLMTRSVVENLKDSKTTMNNEDGQVDLTSPLFPTLLHLTSSKSTDFPPPPPSSSPSSSSLSSSPSSPSPSIPSPSSLPSTSQNQDEAYFTAGVQSLERAATSYFSMQNGHITEYIQLVQDQSQLYKLYSQLLLMNKEQSDGQQQQQQQHQQLSRDQKILEFQQKRVNLLETVLKSGLNAHYYGDVLKQVSFEAAGAYESIVETKESEFTTHCASGGVGSFKSVQCKHAHERDINTSIFKAITTYEQFVALYPPLLTLSRGAESNEQQQRQQDEEEEEEAVAVATALVRMGILWGRLHMIPQQQGQQQQQIDLKDGGDAVGMMMDVDEMLEVKRTWMQKSVDCYSIVDAYYSKNGLQDFDDQIEFVREMLPLLDRMLKDF